MESAVEALYGKGKMCLAPMVRAGTLPLRLLSLHYGADTVYSEELIDYKLKDTEWVKNERLGTMDLVQKNKPNRKELPYERRVVYSTCEAEQGRNVLQLGTSNATRALRAAQIAQPHVAAIDINMGCPKHFSISGGMGAALLSNPDTAVDIIKTLRAGLDIPVTCKIRILDTPELTMELMRKLEKAGAMAIGVHVRHVSERPKDKAHWDALPELVKAVNVPVIANGDIFSMSDALRFQQESNCSSVLIARGALHNPSIFRAPDNLMEPFEVARNYARICALLENRFANTKYTVMRILGDKCGSDTRFLPAQMAKTYEEFFAALGLEKSVWSERESVMPMQLDSVEKLCGTSKDSRIPTSSITTNAVEEKSGEAVNEAVAKDSNECVDAVDAVGDVVLAGDEEIVSEKTQTVELNEKLTGEEPRVEQADAKRPRVTL